MNENDVIAALRDHLETSGWAVTSTAATTQTGYDLEAVRTGTGERLIVEAKGATSSKAGSKRFGKPFTGNQVAVHIAVALLWAAKMRDGVMGGTQPSSTEIGLAFPDDPPHRKQIGSIARTLKEMNVRVYLVSDRGVVTIQ